MAKISPVSIKYIIYAKFVAEGAVEKPDIIGAVFGQTEGLLGAELEMRELQKEGKIGRVEVKLSTEGGSTSGEIEIPTAIDKSETTLIAAALETIERIGPSNAKIEVEKIEDVRANKRDFILERAKKLMENIQGTSLETREMKESVKESTRISKVQEYGIERLPCGDISEEEIIIVEGRADVVNLVRNGVYNVIGMNGTILPETIKELSKEKRVTLFLDGDRGGKLIAKNVTENARVEYIAVAPDGKEVEELTGKEILMCLRKKMTLQEYLRFSQPTERYDRFNRYPNYNNRQYNDRNDRPRYDQKEQSPSTQKDSDELPPEPLKESPQALTDPQRTKINEYFEEINGTKTALLLDKNLEVLKKASSKNISTSLDKVRSQVYALVMDGTVITPIIRAAENAGCNHIAAKNFAFSDETKVNLISL